MALSELWFDTQADASEAAYTTDIGKAVAADFDGSQPAARAPVHRRARVTGLSDASRSPSP